MLLPEPAAASVQAFLVPPAAPACSAKELLLLLQPCSSGYLKESCCLPGGRLLLRLPMAHAKAAQLPLRTRSPHAPRQHPCPGLGVRHGQRVQPHRPLPGAPTSCGVRSLENRGWGECWAAKPGLGQGWRLFPHAEPIACLCFTC